MTEQDLAELLRNARVAAGISQRELSRRMGRNADNSFISRWELGQCLKYKADYFTALEICGVVLVVKKN